MASNETEGLRALRQFAQKKMQLDCGESDDRRLSEWMQILSEWTFTNASARDLIGHCIWEGVLFPICGLVWVIFINVHEMCSRNPGFYSEVLERARTALDVAVCQQIEHDVYRTFPEHLIFKTPVGRSALVNVITAYAYFSLAQVGYQQGISFLAAVSLTQLPEEMSFWFLVHLMKHEKLSSLYLNESTEGALLHECQTKLLELIQQFLPDLYNHLLSLDLDIGLVTQQWFRTLFAYNLPLAVVYRFWDLFLLEGMDVMIWVAFTIFYLCKGESLFDALSQSCAAVIC